MPKYHVFQNGLLVFPNDLTSFKQATTRFREAVAMTAGRPRGVLSPCGSATASVGSADSRRRLSLRGLTTRDARCQTGGGHARGVV